MSATKGFGDRLAQARREKAAAERRDINQKDVAAAIGSSAASVSRWEAGVGIPSDRLLERIAQFFGVTLAWLRYGQEPQRVNGVGPEWTTTAERFGLQAAPMKQAETGNAAKQTKKKRRA